MMRQLCVSMACATLLLMTSGTASAQYRTPGGTSTGVSGEDYHVEVAYSFWCPERDIVVSSESLGIIGTNVDAVTDLGFPRDDVSGPEGRAASLTQVQVPVRLHAHHKLRRRHRPDPNGHLQRPAIHRGAAGDFRARLEDLRFGTEFDFIARSRGFLGFIVEGKFTDMDLTITAPLINEFTNVKVPIPTIGAIGRVYVAKNVAITGELTGLKLTIDEDTGRYVEFDVNGLFNINRYVGVQGGYRTLSLESLD